jgi:uncharacterized protein YrzB (UPF0473 family)
MDIRSILNIIEQKSSIVNADSVFSDKFKVMSLSQFVNHDDEEEVAEADEDPTQAPADPNQAAQAPADPNQAAQAQTQAPAQPAAPAQKSVDELATISDEALDNAYHYGRSSPGNTFGWQANLKSAEFAKKLIDAGETDIEKISNAIHNGWNVTAKAFVNNPDQFDDTKKLRDSDKLDAKLKQREALMNKSYAELPDEEQEKDRVVARALLKAITGQDAEATNESLNYIKRLAGLVESDEVDEAKLGGVSARTVDEPELTSYLDRIVGKPDIDKKTGQVKLDKKGKPKFKSGKTKQDKYRMPFIHRSNIIPIIDEQGKKYNLDKLRNAITERPAKILKQNEKMQHSDGSASAYYNVGLPALVGLAVNEDNGEFVVIDTCPGAGACKTYCYAMKGGYVQWKAVSLSQSRLLNFLYNDPQGFMDMLGNEVQENSEKLEKIDKKKGTKTKLIIRWHDAGDFFSPQYLSLAYALAMQYPNVDFYAYTKLASVAQGDTPKNFKMNFSQGAKPGEENKIDFEKTKNSRVVPEVLFKDLLDRDKDGKLFYKDESALKQLKQRIAAKYSVDPESVITYNEMMKTPFNDKNKWNVIVKPGDGDDSANRSDVLNTFLLIH